MGQAKKNQQNLGTLMKDFPYCIYCGGSELATSIDHFPARIIFDGKDRPKGWEFPACDVCNSGAKHVDLVAAMVAGLYPDPATDQQKADQAKILKGISNNITGAIREMRAGRASQKLALGALGKQFDVGAVVISPIFQKYLDIFCQKFVLAAHFEATKKIVSNDGAILGKWVTNLESYKASDALARARQLFPSLSTLQQGKKSVAGQFDYALGHDEQKQMTVCFARFRQSFEVYGTAGSNVADYVRLERKYPGQMSSPAKLKILIQSLPSKPQLAVRTQSQ